jgi:hypothetical protein
MTAAAPRVGREEGPMGAMPAPLHDRVAGDDGGRT